MCPSASNNSQYLDGKTILNAIAEQQGILIERAEDIYSFSNLALQEFLVAQHIVNNDIIHDSLNNYLSNRRWHEVFLLVSELTRSADEYLLSIEKIINQYLKNSRLKPLLYWCDQIAINSNSEMSSCLKRAIAIFWAMNFEFDPALKFIQLFDSNIVKKITKEKEINQKHDVFAGKVKHILNIDHVSIKPDFNFSAKEVSELDNYFYLNLLLVEAKLSATKVGRQTWNIIEDRLLRVDDDFNIRSLEIAKTFFQKSGIKDIQNSGNFLLINSITNELPISAPMPFFATIKLTENIVSKFANFCKISTKNNDNSGILFYQELPDTLARLRISQVRLSQNIKLIPIPLAEVENAIKDDDDISCRSVLVEYVNRYIGRVDFFDDRNAISDTLSFFGRMDLLHKLEEELLNGQGIGLFGMRKSGKTSVLFQLGFLLREHPVIHIDLQRYGSSQYGAGLFNYIVQQLSKLANDRIDRDVPKFDNFLAGTPAKELSIEFIQRVSALTKSLSLAKYKLPIICLLDEIEIIFPTSQDSRSKVEEFNAVFGSLRVLCQDRDRKLSLLVSDINPDCNRVNYWSHKGIPTNPVFKFFKEIFLTPFDENETSEMIASIGKLMGLDFDNNVLLEIHKESGGHPFVSRQITRLLCQDRHEDKISIIKYLPTIDDWENLLFDYDELNNYFEESVWGNYKKRNSELEMLLLRILAINTNKQEYLQETHLLTKLNNINNIFSKSQSSKAINNLLSLKLIERKKESNNRLYKIQMPHFLRWIQMHMSEEEINQCLIVL